MFLESVLGKSPERADLWARPQLSRMGRRCGRAPAQRTRNGHRLIRPPVSIFTRQPLVHESSVEIDMACAVCWELQEYHLDIPFSSLREGCQACQLLKAGVTSVLGEDIPQVKKLTVSVDISLFVTALDSERDQLMVVEFFTLRGTYLQAPRILLGRSQLGLAGSPSKWPYVGPGRHVRHIHRQSLACLSRRNGCGTACPHTANANARSCRSYGPELSRLGLVTKKREFLSTLRIGELIMWRCRTAGEE